MFVFIVLRCVASSITSKLHVCMQWPECSPTHFKHVTQCVTWHSRLIRSNKLKTLGGHKCLRSSTLSAHGRRDPSLTISGSKTKHNVERFLGVFLIQNFSADRWRWASFLGDQAQFQQLNLKNRKTPTPSLSLWNFSMMRPQRPVMSGSETHSFNSYVNKSHMYTHPLDLRVLSTLMYTCQNGFTPPPLRCTFIVSLYKIEFVYECFHTHLCSTWANQIPHVTDVVWGVVCNAVAWIYRQFVAETEHRHLLNRNITE